MRHSHAAPSPQRPRTRGDWETLQSLLPYLWAWKGRVIFAIACLVSAKLANVGVPLVLKQIVDDLTPVVTASPMAAAASMPVFLLMAYGALRFSSTLFTELRELLFARVTQHAVRQLALQTFRHLHSLSLRFHLERQTGGVTRDIERGTRGISSLVSYALYSILPTLVEIALVLTFLVISYDVWFAVITVCALVSYVLFTILVTEWRTHFRRSMNELDSKANTRAVDSLLNYETVKYFSNESFETSRYNESLCKWEEAAIKSQTSLSVLNCGQSLIIATAVALILWRATAGVMNGQMTLGDLVLVNAFMIQLYIPLNFLGVIYREIKQSLADIDRLFSLLEHDRDVADSENAKPLALQGAHVRFDHVSFSYDGRRTVLHDVDFEILPGQTVAVVGESGAGKSTLSRLLFRFYDVSGGRITIDGQDIREVTQDSLRMAIGIVPQDTVLFNDTIAYNIGYGRIGASQQDIEEAARLAHLEAFIKRLPDGWNTVVGERGLKLSGGEKQRVAIARTILKQPALLVFDEATSALDSHTEQVIQQELKTLARSRSTLVIAHRLSTVVHADCIIVMREGRVMESGTHEALLAHGGLYASMWLLQQKERADMEPS
jgi:ABC-type transport system involved in Fe-S cluster assembly fused permease/ATPase subunit